MLIKRDKPLKLRPPTLRKPDRRRKRKLLMLINLE